MRISEILDTAPFDSARVQSTAELNGRFFAVVGDKGETPGLWMRDAAGWQHVSNGAGRYNRIDGIATTDGALYMAADHDTLFRWDGGDSWTAVSGAGETEGTVVSDGARLVLPTGSDAVGSLKVVDPAADAVREVALDRRLNADDLKLRFTDDGTLFARNADGVFRIDLDDGAVAAITDTVPPEVFARSYDAAPPPADGPGAAAALADGDWTTFRENAPALNERTDSAYSGIAVIDGNLYVALDNHYGAGSGDAPGLYRFDGDSWTQVTPFTHRYGVGDMVAGDDGKLYLLRHDGIHRVDPATGTWLDTTAGTNLAGADVRGLHAAHGKVVAVSDSGAPAADATGDLAVSVLDTTSGAWQHVPLDHEIGKKPGVEALVDGAGALWLATRYDGIFRAAPQADGGYGAFEQVAPAREGSLTSGALFQNDDGVVHISYETTQYTQISGVFRYTGGTGTDAWEQVHQGKGYAVDGHPVAGTGVTAMLGGRFPEYAFDGTKKWPLPEAPGTAKDASFLETASGEGALFGVQNVDGEETLVGLDVAETVGSMRPYDSDLTVQTARNLATAETADATGAAGLSVLADGRIVAAVNTSDGGRLAVVSPDGTETRASFDTAAIRDLAAGPGGAAAYAASDAGVLRVTGDGAPTTVLDEPADRVAVDAQGRIARLADKTVTVTDGDGGVIQTLDIDASYVEDVALDAGTGMVYVVGFSNDHLPDGNPVQGPHLRAYDVTTGELAWSRFEFDGGQKGSNIADARLYRVEIGADGELYVLGESAGTQTVFRYDGTALSGEDILTKIDHHNDLWNTASAHVAYHARVDKATGEVDDAQLTMPRLPSSGESNTFRVGDIAADGGGRVYIGGETFASLANRKGISINGRDVPPYDGSDPAVMALTSDFQNRMAWHSLDAGGADGQVAEVATHGDTTVLLSDYAGGELFTTQGPANDGGAASHLTVIDGSSAFGLPETGAEPGGRESGTAPGDGASGETPASGSGGDDGADAGASGSGSGNADASGSDATGAAGSGGEAPSASGGSGAASGGEAGASGSGGDVDVAYAWTDAVTASEPDVHRGTSGSDDLAGGAGADVFLSGPGDDAMSGGAGTDRAVFAGERDAYTVSFGSGGTAQVEGPDGADSLDGVERLVFADGTLAAPGDANAVAAYRLYEATFDRAPDAAGLDYWVAHLDNGDGDAYAAMVQSFMASEEYANRYGTGQTDADFVTAVYENVLDRQPDDAGMAYWTGQMADGFAPWRVLASFAESQENVTTVASQIDDGIWMA